MSSSTPLFPFIIWQELLARTLAKLDLTSMPAEIHEYLTSRLPNSAETDWEPLSTYWTRINEKRLAKATREFAAPLAPAHRGSCLVAVVRCQFSAFRLRADASLKQQRRELDDWLDAHCSDKADIGDRRLLRDKALEHLEWAISDLAEGLLDAGVELRADDIEQLGNEALTSHPLVPVDKLVKAICAQPPAICTSAKRGIARICDLLQSRIAETAATKRRNDALLLDLRAVMHDG